MESVIARRPKTPHGVEILDQLEARWNVSPEVVADDGTRRYHVEGDVDFLDPKLDEIDTDWRDHLETP